MEVLICSQAGIASEYDGCGLFSNGRAYTASISASVNGKAGGLQTRTRLPCCCTTILADQGFCWRYAKRNASANFSFEAVISSQDGISIILVPPPSRGRSGGGWGKVGSGRFSILQVPRISRISSNRSPDRMRSARDRSGNSAMP